VLAIGDVDLEYAGQDGVTCRVPLSQCWDVPFELVKPVREIPRHKQRTIKNIVDTLQTVHGMTDVSYSTVQDYIVSQRGRRTRRPGSTSDPMPTASPSRTTHRSFDMSWSPAHHAVEHENLPQLRDLLDAGHDVENDDGDGWTLLRHAIDVEYDGHIQTGEPLHADVTAFLIARGANPLRPGPDGIPAATEAELRGHWLAAEIMHAWIDHGQRPTQS